MSEITTVEFWEPLLTVMHETAPAKTSQTTFTSSVSRGSFSGPGLADIGARADDGDAENTRTAALFSILQELAPSHRAEVSLCIDRHGSARVTVTELGDQVEVGTSGVATALLAERLPPPYRVMPEMFEVPDAPADAEAVRRIVRSAAVDPAPTEPAAIEQFERTQGIRLPKDVRSLYSVMSAGNLDTGEEDSYFGIDVRR